MTTIAQREANRDAQRRRRAKPGVNEAGREYMRKRRLDVEYKASENAAQKSRLRDPETWPSVAIRGAKFRAKKRGMEFSLTPADVVLPEFCPVLGVRLVAGLPGNTLHNPNGPSIDRIDSSKGYTPDNCRVISTRANLLKKDGTIAEMQAVLAYMIREGAP